MKRDATADVLRYLSVHRRIFGVCPTSGRFFRLSDCRVFLKIGPRHDWYDELETEQLRVEQAEERFEANAEALREQKREEGRRHARLAVRKIDQIFTPRRLDPADAYTLFHPVDYVVFNGLSAREQVTSIVLLDRLKDRRHGVMQRSIERVVERGQYEWCTIRVADDGSVKVSD